MCATARAVAFEAGNHQLAGLEVIKGAAAGARNVHREIQVIGIGRRRRRLGSCTSHTCFSCGTKAMWYLFRRVPLFGASNCTLPWWCQVFANPGDDAPATYLFFYRRRLVLRQGGGIDLALLELVAAGDLGLFPHLGKRFCCSKRDELDGSGLTASMRRSRSDASVLFFA